MRVYRWYRDEAGPERTYRVHEFAALTGVSVRALHHCDRLGLLKPRRATSQYRIYVAQDVAVLEQIVALKFIGISLRDIKRLLRTQTEELQPVLAAQRAVLEEKRRRPGALQHIIEVLKMQDPSGPRAQELAGRWLELLSAFAPKGPVDPQMLKYAAAYHVRRRVAGRGPATRTAVRETGLGVHRESDRSPAMKRRPVSALLARQLLPANPLRQLLPAGLAIPLLEGPPRNLAFDEQLRELAALSLTLERHIGPLGGASKINAGSWNRARSMNVSSVR